MTRDHEDADGAAGSEEEGGGVPRLRLSGPAAMLRGVRAGRQKSKHHPEGVPPRPPWSPSLLTSEENQALTALIGQWVAHYNHTLAVHPSEVIPPCWAEHPGLVAELAVWTWYWHEAHVTARDPATAAEFYTRHLPAFRDRVRLYLGADPAKCRAGAHPGWWHEKLDDAITAATQEPDPAGIGIYDYGFPPGAPAQSTVNGTGP